MGKEEMKRFLDRLYHSEENLESHWNFTVYSTYSTAATGSSEEAFAESVCERFEAYIESYLLFNAEESYDIEIPLGIEFIRLPSASIQDARAHFRAKYGWPEKPESTDWRGGTQKYNNLQYSLFIVIDEETISNWNEWPEALETAPRGKAEIEYAEDIIHYYHEKTGEEEKIVIKVVEVDYDIACGGIITASASRRPTKDSKDCVTFHGFMKTTPRFLQGVWGNVLENGSWMRSFFKGNDVVYRG